MADNKTVLSLIKDTTKWHEWHPAYMPGSPSPEGLSIKPIVANDSEVVMQLQQFQRRPVVNGWRIHRYSYSDSTTLQWYMDFQLGPYPWQKFSSMLYESTFGRMMQKGLTNIKGIVEGEDLKSQ